MSAAGLFDDLAPPQDLREHLATLRERIIRAKTPQARVRLAGEYYRMSCSIAARAADPMHAGPDFDLSAPFELVPLPADVVPDFDAVAPRIIIPPSPATGPCVWWEVAEGAVLGNHWGEVSLTQQRLVIECNTAWFAEASPHELPEVLKAFGHWGRMAWFDTHVEWKKKDPKERWAKRRASCMTRCHSESGTVVSLVLTRTADELQSFGRQIEGVSWSERVRLTDLHEMGHALDTLSHPHERGKGSASGSWYERLLQEAFAEVFSTYMALAEGFAPATIIAEQIGTQKWLTKCLREGDRASGLDGDGFIYDYAPAVADAIARHQREGAVGGVQDATFVTAATVADFAAGRLPPAPWVVDEVAEPPVPTSSSAKRRRRKRRKARPATASTIETTSVPQHPPS